MHNYIERKRRSMGTNTFSNILNRDYEKLHKHSQTFGIAQFSAVP